MERFCRKFNCLITKLKDAVTDLSMLKADELDVELVMPSSTTDYRGIKFKSGEAFTIRVDDGYSLSSNSTVTESSKVGTVAEQYFVIVSSTLTADPKVKFFNKY